MSESVDTCIAGELTGDVANITEADDAELEHMHLLDVPQADARQRSICNGQAVRQEGQHYLRQN
jgi:hypothetical protein